MHMKALRWIRCRLPLLLVFLFLGATALPASAVPAFARQTGKACSSCHFQHFPTLNDFGMDFKAGGYVDMKNKPVAGPDLSLADSLYGSLFTKIRYQKTNGTDGTPAGALSTKSTHSGELQFPDEFALLLGGRVAKNIGFMLEGQLAGGGPVLAGFKMPMVWEVAGQRLGVVPFTTDALGASYGFELLSTGAVRNVRVNEHRSETSAQQYVFFQGTAPGGNTAGASTGFSFYLHNPNYYVVVAPHMPNHLPGGDGQLGGLSSTYFRAVVTPNVAGWGLAAGLQAWTGSNSRFNDGAGVVLVSTKGWAVDAQAQGSLGAMPLGVYFAHARAPGTAAGSTAPNLFNANVNARAATTLTAELGVLPQKATVQLSFRRANNGAATAGSDNATTLGATYQLEQNVQFQIAHSIRQKGNGGVGRYGPNNAADGTRGGDALTTLMLQAGF
jgi:hypothetical protein